MKQDISFRKAKPIILVSAFILATMRGTIFWPFYANTTSLLSLAWADLIAWILLTILIIQILRKDGAWKTYVTQWQKEKVLLAFLLFAFLSIFWSVSPSASFYRVTILWLSAFSGAYIGFRYDMKQILEMLFWFGVGVITLSIGLSLLLPKLFVMDGWPYFGSWRGIDWHRNHLGTMAAFLNMVFLVRSLTDQRKQLGKIIPDIIFYFFSLIVVFLAKSATGYILTIGLLIIVIIAEGLA